MLLFLAFLLVASQDPDKDRNVTALITSKGYPCEQHFAITPDGFILSLQRINPRRSGKPVFLQHGLLDSSATWVMNSASQSLAFILADAGYDVWLGNSRGNVYSRQNTRLNPGQPQFWDWTWDEMAHFDVPTVVDYVLGQTKASKLSWIGHSRGTQMMFAALPNNVQLAKKLNIFIALAPVAFLGNVDSPLLHFLSWFDTNDLLDELGIHEFLRAGTTLDEILPELCTYFPRTCDDLGYLLFGCCDPQNFNQTRLPVYWNHIPAGTSAKEMAHYSQGVRNGGDSMYDYGTAGNNLHYGQPTPPKYDPSKIPQVPIALFTGSLDILADPTDVQILYNLIKQRVVFQNNQPDYSHMAFTWGQNAAKDIYPSVVNLLKQYA